MRRMLGSAITLGAVVSAAALATLAPSAAAQGTTSNGNTFDWSGAIPAGSWIRIHDLNGGIDVEQATGSDVSVHAEKKWRRGDPSTVRFVVFKEGSDVAICALWHEGDTCDESGYHSHGDHDDDQNDVSVHFTVQLPKGVKIAANTVNGSLDIRGAGAEVDAHTVNGRIDASTSSGPVRAETVNGSIHVRMAALPGDGDLRYHTVNGSITAELPATLDADVDMETVNGSLSSDFPLTVQGRFSPRHMRATIGKGGRRLELRTVNGSVELRKLT